MIHILLIFSFLLSSSHAAVQDFCVADYTTAPGPAGYSCKPPAKVTADDFVYSGLQVPGNFTNFKAAVNPAFVSQLPGINGLGIGLARADLAPGGAVPLHNHRGASEAIVVAKGIIIAGIISSANTVYSKELTEGDVMVFPRGLLHFQVNVGKTPALIWAAFNSEDPGAQLVSLALFSNNLPSEILERTTLLGDDEVKRLKALLGGSG